MSMNAPINATQPGGLPRGELLGRYRSYADAQKVVDHLAADEDFDIKHLTIVGNDLRTVEHIRTRLSYPRVAVAGAAQGAMFGAFIGLLIYLFSPDAQVLDLGLSVILGMAIWTLVGVIGYAVRKGKRDFASSSQTVATTFDVVCDFSVAGKARQLVRTAGVHGVTPGNDPSAPSAQGAPAAQPPAARPGAGGPQDVQPAPGSSGAPAAATEPAPQQGETGAPAAAGQARRTAYDDLPDGRPRYGVRAGSAGRGASNGETSAPESTSPEGASPESTAPEGPAPGGATPEEEASDAEAPQETPAGGGRTPEQRTPEQRSPEQRPPEQRTPGE